MPEPIDNRLIYEVLKDLQARLANLEGMRREMREGFASLREVIAHRGTRRPSVQPGGGSSEAPAS